MMMEKSVAIAIQARIASQRLRGKVFERLANGVSVIESCLFNAFDAKNKLHFGRSGMSVKVYLLAPFDEEKVWYEWVEAFNHNNSTDLKLILGHPSNVFERYKSLQLMEEPDYIVRLTGDCPLIDSSIIVSIIKDAVKGYHDYTSNVYPEIRTHPDGTDVEVISSSLMRWAISQEKRMTDFAKEHVTPIMREKPPSWASIAHIGLPGLDESHIKYSVDTREDLDRINKLIMNRITKKDIAESKGIKYYEI